MEKMRHIDHKHHAAVGDAIKRVKKYVVENSLILDSVTGLEPWFEEIVLDREKNYETTLTLDQVLEGIMRELTP